MKFPLASLIFLKRSLVFPILLISSISLHWSPRKSFLSLLAILWNSVSKWVYLSFSPLPVILTASLSFLPFKVKLLKGQLFLVSFTPLAVHSSNHSNLAWASTISLKQMTKSYYVSQFKEWFYSSSCLTIKKMQSEHVIFPTLRASHRFKDKDRDATVLSRPWRQAASPCAACPSLFSLTLLWHSCWGWHTCLLLVF